MPNIAETLAPKSDQLDNIDLRGSGPRIFTVTGADVRVGSDQPVTIHLAEFDRPWKPGKNMRRVIAHCWGMESDEWAGRRVELFADEKIKFGNETPGGTRISRMSHLKGEETVAIMVSQGRAGTYKVQPLPDAPKPQPESPAAVLLGEIADAAKAAGVNLGVIAQEWADSHDGQNIREATDLGGLELVRDDLRGRAS